MILQFTEPILYNQHLNAVYQAMISLRNKADFCTVLMVVSYATQIESRHHHGNGVAPILAAGLLTLLLRNPNKHNPQHLGYNNGYNNFHLPHNHGIPSGIMFSDLPHFGDLSYEFNQGVHHSLPFVQDLNMYELPQLHAPWQVLDGLSHGPLNVFPHGHGMFHSGFNQFIPHHIFGRPGLDQLGHGHIFNGW